MNLSVGIITFNEAAKIGRTLASVQGWTEQIVIVDSGSDDGTQDICRQYGAEVIHQDWLGYGPQKNIVIDHCRGDWILALDADEVVTPELRRAIEQELAHPQNAVYAIRFRHIVFGRTIRHGGWDKDFRTRLFRRRAGRWNNDPVHETFVTAHAIGYLDGLLEHHAYANLEEYLRKSNRYTTLEANAAYENGKRPRLAYSLLYCLYFFLVTYVRKLGFLDGTAGLLLCIYRSLYFFDSERKLADLYAGRLNLPG